MKKTILLFTMMTAALLLTSAVALAVPKITIPTIHYDARGNDNYAENLNNEYVVFKNTTNRAIRMKGWKVHDEGRIHVYTFKRFKLGGGNKITLHTGQGRDTRRHIYWDRSYGAVWNNDGDTVKLKNRSGEVVVRKSY